MGLIYPELSYQIIGCAYEVYNTLGSGLREKVYENALAVELDKRNISYRRQVYVPIVYAETRVGSYFLDFLIDDKIIVELKLGEHFSQQEIFQVGEYLQRLGHPLAIIVKFTTKGVRQKRILHPDKLSQLPSPHSHSSHSHIRTDSH